MRRGPIPIALFLIPVAAFIVVFPLLLHGCSCGHDFDFHLVSWMEAALQFKAGHPHPSWALSPAWNAGEPRFVFYPPISWSLGALLGLMLPWNAVPIVYTWIALTASGFAMYSLGRTLLTSTQASLTAAIVYLANPYMLFTAYERTAYAELLAAAWMPLLLAAVLRERVTPLRIAVPVALLWLTNAPAAVMGCYALAVMSLMRLFWVWLQHREVSPSAAAKNCAMLAGQIVAGVSLGLGLAAFYILPAAFERRWVQIAMANVEGMRIQDNFLFHRTADALHDQVLHSASLIAVAVLAAAIVILLAVLLRPSHLESAARARFQAISLLVLALIIGALLTPLTAAIWHIAPEMTFLQFPWRLTVILAAVFCAGLALALGPIHLRPSLQCSTAFVVVISSVWLLVPTFNQACDDGDTVAARLAVFNHQMGSEPTDEYTAANADNEALSHNNPPFWLTADGNAPAPSSGQQPGPAPTQFAVTTDHDSVFVLNLREFPAWSVRINGIVEKQRVERADGLIAVPLHAGRSNIDISYAMTFDRKLGDGTTLAAVCATIALLPFRRRGSSTSRIIKAG